MEIVFPKNIVNDNGIIKSKISNEKVRLIDARNPLDNLITIDNVDYCFTYLDSSGRNRGGNSIILKLYEIQNLDLENLEYGDPDLILKISKFKSEKFETKAEKRFNREVNALRRCKAENFENVVSIYHSGVCKLIPNGAKPYSNHLFYTMEYAESDLKSFIENNTSISLYERVELCLNLAKGLQELESIGYYHRDIKPDNIFIVGDRWKIADLGLVEDRNDNSFDKENEWIGPRGWMSPEAMNKFLCEEKPFTFIHDCTIDHQSDIFQLGKVFCYIIQNNNPMGIFKQKDLYITDNQLYQIIRTMLNQPKNRRFKRIEEVIDCLKTVHLKLLKKS